MMFAVGAAAVTITMMLALLRALLGPSVYDRVLAVNMLGTKTVLLLALTAFAMGRPDFIDLAITYALINFIGVIAVLQFFYSRDLRKAEERAAKSAHGGAVGPSQAGPQ
ncbi:MAG: monovalent cation/H+ antiporter complex subunit F [Xanthomonadales bacterium]|nr:monovalent cation/H+ antiporter complex subunit F [Xanthomonadales bacterium]